MLVMVVTVIVNVISNYYDFMEMNDTRKKKNFAKHFEWKKFCVCYKLNDVKIQSSQRIICLSSSS